ncbi:hypothetical protein [Pseudoalteromonas sp. SR41-7]|uniref:hypothetical protein n=1 Tax=Pseudoalteromonas sp. SR41-7 TaxID=2760947 RepID=UPI0015FED800|nr:hypothetical protein [Pseudoalteromonas sp. SR41-7]MBB1296074.1 hypothetical protein [Pseudoalteromonas sp. SR41-7]
MIFLIRTLPLLLILALAAALHLVMFDDASSLSVGALWSGFFFITTMLYLKFDYIKLDDWYEELSFKDEWFDYFLAAKMLDYWPWVLFLIFVVVAFILRSA